MQCHTAAWRCLLIADAADAAIDKAPHARQHVWPSSNHFSRLPCVKRHTCVQVVGGVYKALCDSKAKPKIAVGMLDQVDAATMLQKALARILPFLGEPHWAVM